MVLDLVRSRVAVSDCDEVAVSRDGDSRVIHVGVISDVRLLVDDCESVLREAVADSAADTVLLGDTEYAADAVSDLVASQVAENVLDTVSDSVSIFVCVFGTQSRCATPSLGQISQSAPVHRLRHVHAHSLPTRTTLFARTLQLPCTVHLPKQSGYASRPAAHSLQLAPPYGHGQCAHRGGAHLWLH